MKAITVMEPGNMQMLTAEEPAITNPDKENLEAVVMELTSGEGVNVIFEAAGIPALLSGSTALLSPAGRLVAMTFGEEPIPINFKEVNSKGIDAFRKPSSISEIPGGGGISAVETGHVDKLITHVFPAESFEKAFDVLADKTSGAGKVILTFD